MFTLPATLPVAYTAGEGVTVSPADVDTGGYDFLIGGHGFRLANDPENPYQRTTEPTTVRRYDSSQEPGEQSLATLPWPRSQSSFHGGAGQLNLEQGRTPYQYQQEQVEHVRFQASLGIDCWTPGEVKRLPDCRWFNFGFTSTCMVTGAVDGVDYAVIGGVGGLYQAKWAAGPDADPTVTAIDLTGSAFGGASNCTVTSLTTDGVNYYALIELTVVGYVAGVLTYVASGPLDSVAAPTALYEVPNTSNHATLTNLCTNPSFEVNTTSWVVAGANPPTFATSAVRAVNRSKSGLIMWATGSSFFNQVQYVLPTTSGFTYTVRMQLWVPTGSPTPILVISNGGTLVSAAPTKDAWQTVTQTFTATGASSTVAISGGSSTTAGQTCYVDAVMMEVGATPHNYFDGDTLDDATYVYTWSGAVDGSTSVATPVVTPLTTDGVLGWAKERLIAGLGTQMYELPTADVAEHSALPSPRYTHPNEAWQWTAVSESPGGVLVAGLAGGQASVLEFTLDTSGGTPFLSGGASVAILPLGEAVYGLNSVLGTFLGIATSRGIRVGTFDTYSGALKYGPLVVETTQPVLSMTSRDRFLFGSYTNQQQDGTTGLVRVDLSMVIDSAGRNAWAADLRPPTGAPTRQGNVTGTGVLPTSGRLLFVTPEGIHVEGDGPGSDGDAWIKTSRIRYGTTEPKLFKLGRLHGTLDVANIQVTGIAPFKSDTNLGTFGFIPNGDPGEFRLPTGLNEWIQLKFTLEGSAAVLNSYAVKALPAPKRQHIITLTALCFEKETDRFGNEAFDAESPRQRYQNVRDLEAAGDEIRFVEFTNRGAVAELVVIDQLAFVTPNRPSIENDLGGYITMRLRATET